MGVVVKQYGTIEEMDPASWPLGEHYLEILEKEGVHLVGIQKSATFWQLSARWALLRKYGLYNKSHYGEVEGRKQLVFSDSAANEIQRLWREATTGSDAKSDDLRDFLQTGRSNNRQLKWSTMDCPAGAQFKLHAHPNLELVYCVRGELHEVRMKGEPLTKDFEKVPTENGDDTKVKGPDLSSLKRPWYFDTMFAGEWLVNEVGSIHKSFTASKGDGCLLIVLWGGSHADVTAEHEPQEVDVVGAVNAMDAKLKTCDCTKWEKLEETFLPQSERSDS